LTSRNYILKTFFGAIIIIANIFSSCSKGKHPSIKIITPTNEQVFNAPDTVEISADLQDTHDALFSEYLVVTKVNSTNDTVINFQDHTFTGDLYTYHLIKKFVSEPLTRYKIVVSASGEGFSSDSIFVNAN
jgi:hypothetical protein